MTISLLRSLSHLTRLLVFTLSFGNISAQTNSNSSYLHNLWVGNSNESYLLMLEDGSYYFLLTHHAGFEYGSYSENLIGPALGIRTGNIKFTKTLDSNGSPGQLQEYNATATVASYSTLSFTDPANSSSKTTYQPALNPWDLEHFANLGIYQSDNKRSVLLVISNTKAYLLQTDSVDETSHAGIDHRDIGEQTTQLNRIKTNGVIPLGGESLNFADNNTAIVVSGEQSKRFTRLQKRPSPHSHLKASAVASYRQSSGMDPEPTPLSPDGSKGPFRWETSVPRSLSSSYPFFAVSPSVGHLLTPDQSDATRYIHRMAFSSQLAMQSADAFPVTTAYQYNLGGTIMVLFNPPVATYPPVPRITASAVWDEGAVLAPGGILRFAPHPDAGSITAESFVSLQDPDSGEYLIRDSYFAPESGSIDLSKYLGDGKTLLCTLANGTVVANTESGTTRGYLSNATENIFLLRSTASTAGIASPLLPPSLSLAFGDRKSLFVTSDGSIDNTYQWYKDGIAITGQTASSLYFPFPDSSAYGAYHVVARNGFGEARSNVCYVGTGSTGFGEAFVAKDVRYKQTGPASAVLDPDSPSGEEQGAYGVSVHLTGSWLHTISPPRFTPPSGATPGFSTALTFDTELLSWVYKKNGKSFRTQTKTLLDGNFPPGVYTIGYEPPKTARVTLANAAFPNAPVLTLTGGNWVNGIYAIGHQNVLNISSNAFTGILGGVGGGIYMEYGNTEVETSNVTDPSRNSIFLNTLPIASAHEINIAFTTAYNALQGHPLTGPTVYSAFASSTRLCVHVLPHVTGQPTGATIASGGNHIFGVRAGGTLPTGRQSFLFQWKKDGVPMAGETQDRLSIRLAKLENSGSYSCDISNDVGVTTTQAAVLSVAPDPYEEFLAGVGLTPESLGPDNADANANGTPNLLEFVLAAGAPMPVATRDAEAGTPRFKFVYHARKSADYIQQDVEYSSNLEGPWKLALEGVANVTRTRRDIGNGIQRIEVSIPVGGEKCFGRIRTIRH